MHERQPDITSPNEFIIRTLGNEKILKDILLKDKLHPQLPSDIGGVLDRFSSTETLGLTRILLLGLSSDEKVWHMDRKDGALRLLSEISFNNNGVKPIDLSLMYKEALDCLGETLDPMGSVYSLIEAGEVLTHHMPIRQKYINPITAKLDSIKVKLNDQIPGGDDTRRKIDKLVENLKDKSTREARHHVRNSLSVISRAPKRAAAPLFRKARRATKEHAKRKPRGVVRKSERYWGPNTPESKLISAAKKGDSGALTAIVHKTYNRVYGLARRISGDHEDALDITQEVYRRALRGISQFREESTLTTWLHRITANVASDHLRKRTRDRDLILDDANLENLTSEADSEALSLAHTERDALLKAIASLPERLRAVIILFDIYDLPHSEIADRLEITKAAAKVRLHRARRKLREMLFPN